MELRDKYNRIADYLRIGVTDRCNLRCRYCMPEEGIDFSDRSELLNYEELIRLGKIFQSLGVNKIRFTGGEPFIRKDFGMLLEAFSKLFPSVHITTNATYLGSNIPLLQRIGIGGLNISIDSLNRDRFFMITRRDVFESVIENIHACLQNSIPVKVNMVVMKGVNDDEILDFVQFGIDHNIEVRFIEAMPFNDDDGNKDVFLSAMEILSVIKTRHTTIQKVDKDGPSSSLKYLIENKYKIGIIPAYSRSLCGSCNRIRLTPKGEMLTCLYSKTGIDLKTLIRDSKNSDEDIKREISNAVQNKLKSGFEEEALRGEEVFNSMTTIGG